MTHQATKISIVTEKLIEAGVEKICLDAGATGYTVFEGSGKGSHGVRTRDRPSVVGAFALVKIEVIVADRATADQIAEKIASTYFQSYPGIVYLETVEILRRDKF